MVTLYELLGIDENADKETIKNAYEARMGHPALDDKKKNQLKIAVDILLNDAKREKYNKDLSDYRAQELLKNVTVSQESKEETVIEEAKETEDIVQEEEFEDEDENQNESDEQMNSIRNDIFGALAANKERNDNMTEEEKQKEIEEEKVRAAEEERRAALREIEEQVNQKEYEKILKKQEALNKKERKKAEREYKEKYQEAYVTELRNRGYNVKYPWTWKRVRNLLIGIVIVILVMVIAWQIPFIREPLVELYNENVIIKTLVDVIKGIINAILGIFKSN